jgi:molybdopterin molybdotransferase
MDGYALRKEDMDKPLRNIGTIAAGQEPVSFLKGECVAIMTGARVPECADYVIPYENTEKIDENLVKIIKPTRSSNIAYKSQDIRTGQLVFEKNTLISPAHVAMLASVGCTKPVVFKKPTVIVFSTGDEIVEPDQLPSPNQIRNSNGMQLMSQLLQMPVNVDYGGIISDSKEETKTTLKYALEKYDVIVMSGGISMGDFDYIPEILCNEGVEMVFQTIKVKPGKPTLFGIKGNTTIFGLPGNPVSSYIHCEILVKSHIYSRLGVLYKPKFSTLPLAEAIEMRNPDRVSLVPVQITPENSVKLVEYHGSAHIFAMTQADGIIRMEIGQSRKEKGEMVDVRLF